MEMTRDAGVRERSVAAHGHIEPSPIVLGPSPIVLGGGGGGPAAEVITTRRSRPTDGQKLQPPPITLQLQLA